MHNIELKARLKDLHFARQVAAQLATQQPKTEHQVDTYFSCRFGRLKLRQIDGLRAELIWYDRPDQATAKPSHYHLVPVANPETLKAALAAALGIWGVVEKQREIFLWRNVRIHLDLVVGLGSFLEFEAVVGPDSDETASRQALDQLVRQFQIDPDELIAGSYVDIAGLGGASGSGWGSSG